MNIYEYDDGKYDYPSSMISGTETINPEGTWVPAWEAMAAVEMAKEIPEDVLDCLKTLFNGIDLSQQAIETIREWVDGT